VSNKNSMKFRMESHEGTWFIVDPDNADGRVQIDQALVDATHISQHEVEGYILAVHGLDFEVAKRLDRPTLNQLGVAANLRSVPPPPFKGSGLRRVRLEPGGRVAYEPSAGRT
jgi:hypothetical protein